MVLLYKSWECQKRLSGCMRKNKMIDKNLCCIECAPIDLYKPSSSSEIENLLLTSLSYILPLKFKNASTYIPSHAMHILKVAMRNILEFILNSQKYYLNRFTRWFTF